MYIYSWHEPRYRAIKVGLGRNPQRRMYEYAETYGLQFDFGSLWCTRVPPGAERIIEERCHDALRKQGLKPLLMPGIESGTSRELFRLGGVAYTDAARIVRELVEQLEGYHDNAEAQAKEARDRHAKAETDAMRAEQERQAAAELDRQRQRANEQAEADAYKARAKAKADAMWAAEQARKRAVAEQRQRAEKLRAAEDAELKRQAEEQERFRAEAHRKAREAAAIERVNARRAPPTRENWQKAQLPPAVPPHSEPSLKITLSLAGIVCLVALLIAWQPGNNRTLTPAPERTEYGSEYKRPYVAPPNSSPIVNVMPSQPDYKSWAGKPVEFKPTAR